MRLWPRLSLSLQTEAEDRHGLPVTSVGSWGLLTLIAWWGKARKLLLRVSAGSLWKEHWTGQGRQALSSLLRIGREQDLNLL